MVQYAEIKEVESLIDKLKSNQFLTPKDFENITNNLTKYHTILEGWYGDEQYHNKVEEGIEL